MTILIHKLIILGPNKHPAEIDFNGQSHLVYGPTDTGKSYIVECLRYALGSSKKPKKLEYSEGYSLLALQVSNANRENYTIYRSLLEENSAIFQGHYSTMPSLLVKPISEDIEAFILNWAESNDRKILVKAGTLGKFSATDLRHLSIFDEIETLDNVPLEGKDTNLKTRRKSALALALTGSDDTDLELPPSTTDRHIAKGHAEALADEISSLKGEIPEGLSKNKAEAELLRISSEIEKINDYMANNSERIEELKAQRAREEREYRRLSHRFNSVKEALNRFTLLDNKYESDLQRLQTINTAANIVNSFPLNPCPLCMADIKHQVRHSLAGR